MTVDHSSNSHRNTLSIFYDTIADEVNMLRFSARGRLARSMSMTSRLEGVEWNREELLERSVLMEEDVAAELSEPSNSEEEALLLNEGHNRRVGHDSSLAAQDNYRKWLQAAEAPRQEKNKRSINSRIFSLPRRADPYLYYFNLVMKILFRLSLLAVLLLHYFSEKQQISPILVLVGLEGLCVVLYLIGIMKILFLKSDPMAIYFQKEFEQAPYSEIYLKKLFKNQFTLENFRNNITNFLNPRSSFNRNMKISLIRQELFSRMELLFVFLPLFCCYNLSLPWLLMQKNQTHFDMEIMYAIVMLIEVVRLTFHYLVIYILS